MAPNNQSIRCAARMDCMLFQLNPKPSYPHIAMMPAFTISRHTRPLHHNLITCMLPSLITTWMLPSLITTWMLPSLIPSLITTCMLPSLITTCMLPSLITTWMLLVSGLVEDFVEQDQRRGHNRTRTCELTLRDPQEQFTVNFDKKKLVSLIGG